MDPSQHSHGLSPDISGPPPSLLSVGSNNDLSMSLNDRTRTIGNSDQEPVRTLFVSGLPSDVKNRELHNLFRNFGGYQSATVSFTGERKMPVSFVVFSDQESALTARDILQGINFDPESPTTLRIELAKSNSKTKSRKKDHRHEPSSGRLHQRRVNPYASPLPGQSSLYNDTAAYPYFHERVPQFMTQTPARPASQPCSTLFIGNISPQTNESELEATFKNFTGFEKLKISRKGDSIMCFIDFQTVQSSNTAMKALQAMNLPSAEGRRIRIEFARSRMGGQKIPTWS